MAAARWNVCLMDAARRQRGDPDLCWWAGCSCWWSQQGAWLTVATHHHWKQRIPAGRAPPSHQPPSAGFSGCLAGLSGTRCSQRQLPRGWRPWTSSMAAGESPRSLSPTRPAPSMAAICGVAVVWQCSSAALSCACRWCHSKAELGCLRLLCCWLVQVRGGTGRLRGAGAGRGLLHAGPRQPQAAHPAGRPLPTIAPDYQSLALAPAGL